MTLTKLILCNSSENYITDAQPFLFFIENQYGNESVFFMAMTLSIGNFDDKKNKI